MASIELEFDYLPDAADALAQHAGAALGIVLELALCAAQQNDAALCLAGLRFGPALALDRARRCHASCDPRTRRVQVTSVELGSRAAQPIVHLTADLADPTARDPLSSHDAELGPAEEPSSALAAFRLAHEPLAAALPARSRALVSALMRHERGLFAELGDAPADWEMYAIHPLVAVCAHELASFFLSAGADSASHLPLSARRLSVIEPGTRILRLRVARTSGTLDGSAAGFVVIAESEHGVAWIIDGLELADDPAHSAGRARSAEVAAPARAGELSRALLALSEVARRAHCERELRMRVAQLIGMAPSALAKAMPFKDLGLSSRAATELASELANALDRPFAPTVVFDHPTLDQLVAAVLRLVAGEAAPTPSARARAKPQGSVAIVGMACRVAGGADTPEQLWDWLCAGGDAIGPVSPERVALVPSMARHALPAGFLRGIELFDAGFFGTSEREAAAMDPQHRILLEVTWEALERAGIVPATLVGTRTGVFVSAAPYGYGRLVSELDAFTVLGNEPSAASGRLSYFLGLRGPSMCVDAACASSLVAVCLASDSLRRGEIDLAIVGGANLLLEPLVTEGLLAAGVLSSTTRRCRTFDADADGYVRGEACGVLVLRREQDALRAGEPVQALIRGYAVAHGGRANGLGAPSRAAQVDVIDLALADAGVEAREVGYVEAHGTGTVLGDAVELNAISDTYGAASGRAQPVMVGSIKANSGHGELAAGVMSVIKAVLLAQRAELPPQLHFVRPSPAIDWQRARIAVATQRQPWPADLGRRIASVNALGMSGTYAHLLLEAVGESEHAHQYQHDPTAVPADREPASLPCVIAVHGCSEAALRAQASAYAEYLRAGGSAPRLATTTQRHRQHFALRAAVVGADALALQDALLELARSELPHTPRVAGSSPKLAFVYSGLGGQFAGMGQRLVECSEVFRAAIAECDRMLAGRLPCSFFDVMRATADAGRLLLRTSISQPAVFALQHGLTELWRSWGVTPAIVMGHSLGELAAAHVAGVLSLQDALLLAAERGRLMESLPHGGAMAAVEAPRETVERVIAAFPGALWLAAVNSPTQLVISGTGDAVQAACARFERDGVRARPLAIPVAAHSPLLAPILDAFEQSAGRADYRPPTLPIVSSMSGTRLQMEMSSARYYRQQLCAPVEFARAMQALAAEGVDAYLEIGPHASLTGPAAACVEASDKLFAASMVRDRDPLRQMLDAARELYAAGVDLDWEALPCARAEHDPAVPTYAFQRRRYWMRMASAVPLLRNLSEPEPAAGLSADEPESSAHGVQPHHERLLHFPEGEAVARLERLIQAELRKILDPVPAAVDFERTLGELGLGSLGAVQLRSCLQRWVGRPLPLALVSADKTLGALAAEAWSYRTRAA